MSRNTDHVVHECQVDQTVSESSHSITIVTDPGSKRKYNNDAVSNSFDKSNTTESIRRRPRNFLIPSILASLLCFWPLGFAAIWQATKSRRASKLGEYANAKRHSSMAKSFIVFSVALGILQAVVMVTVVMLQLYVFPRYPYNPVETVATRVHQ